MTSKINWKDWRGEQIYSEETEKFYCEPEEFAEQYLDNLCEPIEDAVLPKEVKDCDRTYGSFPSARCIAESGCDYVQLIHEKQRGKGTHWALYRSKPNALDSFETMTEDLYTMCDPEPSDEILGKAIGLQELDEEIERFYSVNYAAWMLFGTYRWYEPSKHSVGLKQLQRALDRATEANKEIHYVFRPGKTIIELDNEFWDEFICSVYG